MGTFEYAMLGIAFAANTYATVRAIKSYRNFNKRLKEIDCYEIRQNAARVAEYIELRKIL